VIVADSAHSLPVNLPSCTSGTSTPAVDHLTNALSVSTLSERTAESRRRPRDLSALMIPVRPSQLLPATQHCSPVTEACRTPSTQLEVCIGSSTWLFPHSLPSSDEHPLKHLSPVRAPGLKD